MILHDFIDICKDFINENNLSALQDFYEEHKEKNWGWDYTYQKIYLHACLKKRVEIVEWLKSLYAVFNPMQQIALRQMFAYGRYLLAK
jgi:hypothetical protein